MGIIVFLIVGLIAGFIARALVPGPDPMGWLGTMVLGIVGSFVGGVLLSLVTTGTFEISATGILGSIVGGAVTHLVSRPANERFHPAGIIFSTLGAILILFICYKLKIHFPRVG